MSAACAHAILALLKGRETPDSSSMDATIEQFLSVFLSLLKDEFPDVRLNIISKLDQVNQAKKWAIGAIVYKIPELNNDTTPKESLRSLGEEETTSISKLYASGIPTLLQREITEACTIQKAVGTTVAWHKDFIVVD